MAYDLLYTEHIALINKKAPTNSELRLYYYGVFGVVDKRY